MKCDECGFEFKKEKAFYGSEKEIKGMFFCTLTCLNDKIAFEKGRKQGALEEQKRFLKVVWEKYGTCIFTKDIEKRIKELEGAK